MCFQKTLLAGHFVLLALLLGASPVHATTFPAVTGAVAVCDPNSPSHCSAPDASGNLPVTGTFSATLAGFTPAGTFATLTATNASASVALPAGATVAIQNTGTTAVSCTLGVGSATAAASQIVVQAASTVFVSPGSNTFGACIDQTGSTSNLVVLAGGSGLGTGFGGGGGSGGGGAITAAINSYAAGALSAGAFAAGAGVDGWDLTQGAKADAVCATPTTTTACSVISLLKAATNAILGAVPITKNGTVTSVTGATPGTAQTGTQVNMDVGLNAVANTALGIPTNFGTSPGAVVVPGANASLFYGTTAAVADPCQTATKAYTPINVVTATNTIITGVSAKKKYVCGIFLYPAGTDNVAIFQATTGTACATALVGVIGGTTTATGMVMTAQAGFVLGTGSAAVAATTVVNTDLCIVTSAAVQLSGVVVTVDQ